MNKERIDRIDAIIKELDALKQGNTHIRDAIIRLGTAKRALAQHDELQAKSKADEKPQAQPTAPAPAEPKK